MLCFPAIFCISTRISFYVYQTLMASIVCHPAWHPFQAPRRGQLGLILSEMTKDRPNCCTKAVSTRHRGTLRTFVGKYPCLSRAMVRGSFPRAHTSLQNALKPHFVGTPS